MERMEKGVKLKKEIEHEWFKVVVEILWGQGWKDFVPCGLSWKIWKVI